LIWLAINKPTPKFTEALRKQCDRRLNVIFSHLSRISMSAPFQVSMRKRPNPTLEDVSPNGGSQCKTAVLPSHEVVTIC